MSSAADNRDLVAWSFLLSGLAIASADGVVLATSLGTIEGEDSEVAWFLPRLVLALPLLAGVLAALCVAAHGALSARAGKLGGLAVDALCVWPFVHAVLDLVSGPKISVSAWRWPIAAVAISIVVAGLIALRWLAVLTVRRALGKPRAATVQAGAFAVLIATTAAGCALTARLFHNLYPAFHQAVTLGALALGAAAAYPVIALQAAPRRFALAPSLALLSVIWLGSGALTWQAAAGRRVFAEGAPFTGIFVPAVFRGDAALRALRDPPAVDGGKRAGPRRAPLATFGFAADAKKPSVLLVTVDAMRGDALDPASAYAPATPELRSLAARALRYERAYASANNTNMSLPVLLSGVVNGTGLMSGEQFVTSAFGANGYDTQAWVTNNYHRAEDEIVALRRVGYFCRSFNPRYAGADEVTAWARSALSGPKPVFVWIHLSDVHEPFKLPEKPVPAGRKLPNEYGRRLAGVDVEVARLLRAAEESGDVIWALTADHGEATGEHGTVGHASTLYEEQIRVPLVIGGAGIEPGRINEPVSTQDLAATLLRLGGARVPEDVTLLPPWSSAGGAPHRSAPVLSYMPQACSIVQGDWKLIADTRTQSLALFHLASDPGELRGRLRDEPERARSMLAALRDAGCQVDLTLIAASL